MGTRRTYPDEEAAVEREVWEAMRGEKRRAWALEEGEGEAWGGIVVAGQIGWHPPGNTHLQCCMGRKKGTAVEPKNRAPGCELVVR